MKEELDADSYLSHHGYSLRIHDNFDAKQLVINLEFELLLEGNEYLKSHIDYVDCRNAGCN